MKTVSVNVSKKYDVIIGENAARLLPEKINELFPQSKVMLVTDDRVGRYHLKEVRSLLCEAGIENDYFVFPNGEKSKSAEVLFRLLEALAEKHFTKSDVLVALGGGVTGDLTGLAAALYLRGVHIVQMPTTLLSAVDSSVGGKTAVNLNSGKNLAGVFNQPEIVICDTKMLDTLSDDIFSDGMAEVIKYGVLADKELFEMVKNGNVREDVEEIISRCVEIKRDIVTEDEFDKGKRQLLNFGHTLGHAIEAESGFKISHGTAVAMGMVLACKISFKNGLTDVDLTEKVKTACQNNGLETACPYSTETLSKYASEDKKISGKSISFIVPKVLGECVGIKMSVDEFLKMLGEEGI